LNKLLLILNKLFFNPKNVKYKKNLATAYIKLSNELSDKTKFSDALKWAKKAYSLFNNSETKENIALIYKANAINLLKKIYLKKLQKN